MSLQIAEGKQLTCYHCGEVCNTNSICSLDKFFCCEGCKMVYEILNQHELCDYYQLNNNPGHTQKVIVRKDKFAFLEDEGIKAKLISFKDENNAHVTFHLPQIHCSSCLYLLENLHKVDHAIISSKVNFVEKEVTVVYSMKDTTLRKVAELLTATGYEPYISLNDLDKKRNVIDKSLVYQLGLAGFCFGNIMLMSFPEYLGIDESEANIRGVFRWINFGLAIPVLLYAALPFYQSSYKSIRHKFLNIDAPIALAIIITFIRSAWEVISGTGGGYFDSMTGIVFFMLAGRILQDKTYRQLSFDRDYTAYFPIAVSVIKNEEEVSTSLPNIKPGDTLLIHNEELIPTDSILTRGKALIDYSFVTGESMPVVKEVGELVYAGGRQTGTNIELLVIKEVSQSYLTGLWNQHSTRKEPVGKSFTDVLSRYFTYVVLTIAVATGVYWYIHDAAKIWPAVTAIFIIACPCALLLSNTFTNGNILRILGRNKFYLRNAQTIEEIAGITHIVFDKTGTLTSAQQSNIIYTGIPLSNYQQQQVAALAACSTHPLSKGLVKHFAARKAFTVSGFREVRGEGIEGFVKEDLLKMGSFHFVTGRVQKEEGTVVYISFENKLHGSFRFANQYRTAIPELVKDLQKHFTLSVLSGDNESEKNNLQKLFGKTSSLHFYQKPEDKLNYIKLLQQKGDTVMMIGDGLNDAGALMQSNVGIALSEQANNFTPASDAILDAGQLSHLTKFIRLCKANQRIVIASFILSICYNVIGLFFAVQGNLSPLIAAILMPSSSLCIFLVTFGSSNFLAKRMKC